MEHVTRPNDRDRDGLDGERQHGRGKFDVNALWGGDQKDSFDVKVNPKAGSVSDLHTKLIGSE
jgi:hypothetical protein